MSFHLAERTFQLRNVDRPRSRIDDDATDVTLVQSRKADQHFGNQVVVLPHALASQHAHAGAPWQELRILLDVRYNRVHRIGVIRENSRFRMRRHCLLIGRLGWPGCLDIPTRHNASNTSAGMLCLYHHTSLGRFGCHNQPAIATESTRRSYDLSVRDGTEVAES